MYRNASRVFAFLFAVGATLVLATGQAVAASGGGSPVVVNGVVHDGSGQGWPLYAKVVVSSGGAPVATAFTDPGNGYYAVTLPGGATYDVSVTSPIPGYVAGGGTLVVPAATAMVANWNLAAAATCTAPGYGPGSFVGAPALQEGFDGGVIPSGWSVDTVSGISWTVSSGADPCGQFDGNRTGGAGPYAIINSACFGDGSSTDDSSLVTPAIDLSGAATAAVRWANDFVEIETGSIARVDVSSDGGTSWTNVWESSSNLPGPNTQVADLGPATGHPGAKVRFHYNGFWAWWWQVDDVEIGAFACAVLPGGLVVGTVHDSNTGAGLNGAVVQTLPDGATATTVATPEDPALGGGFYAVFSESGAQSFGATFPSHDPGTKDATVIPNSTVRLDFALDAGVLDASPRPLSLFASPGGAQSLTLTLTNTGTGTGSFILRELNVAPIPAPAGALAKPAHFASAAARKAAVKRIPFKRLNDVETRALPPLPNAPVGVPALAAAGNVVASFPTGLAAGLGLTYDTNAQRLWISNPYSEELGLPGDDLEYQFFPDGTQTGSTIDIQNTGGFAQVQGAFNARTGMMWQLNLGGDMCLFEMDPTAQIVTGKKICGPWESSQRAVAYDYATDTYYVGGTNEDTIYHIDASGNLLDSTSTGLATTGLAYNPTTGHLFLAGDAPTPFNVWVLDPKNAYALVGGFVVTSGGVPVLQNGSASLAPDCDGHLMVIDPNAQTVFAFESGETGWCANDIPWLSETPAMGTVPGGGSLPVTVTFDPSGMLPGLRLASIFFVTETPEPVAPVPVDFTLLFSDVPQDSFAWNFIYGAAGAGLMPGCAPQAPTFLFCPAEVVTRRSMAGFIERAVHGAATPPPVYLGGFGDVASGSFNANYIQGLVNDRITAGCGGGNYCPDVPVTRAQMAVFVWKGQHGDEPPPACTPPGTYGDVPCPDGFAVDYIEGITFEGITVGCGNGNFCPNTGITNAQMAVFLVKAFNVPYLP